MSYYQEPSAIVYQGHALTVLRELPAESVDCVITSPPYWGLRTYKTEPIIWGDIHCEHEWRTEQFKQHAGRGDCQSSRKYSEQAPVPDMKLGRAFCLKCGVWQGELGLEPIIELYIEHLLQIFDEVKRVLKKTGTCWVNLDDSYASQPSGSRKPTDLSYFENEAEGENGRINKSNVGIPAKSLCLIPQRFAIAMVENGWILRNDIVWYKPNPMPESVKDRFTGSWEHLFFFVKNRTYWFEQQFESSLGEWNSFNGFSKEGPARRNIEGRIGNREDKLQLGRNKRDVWEINTQPNPIRGVHFATFPEKLIETPILSGCPSAICKKCGKARGRIYEGTSNEAFNIRVRDVQKGRIKHSDRIASEDEVFNYQEGITHVGDGIKSVGYTDCGCNAGFVPGVVLDPFAGSGTTGLVAKKLGRKYIGIELSENYCKMHVKRLQGIPLAMEFND